MVEDDDRDGQEGYSLVVVTLEGKRWEHIGDTSDGKRVVDSVGGSEGC